MMKKLMMFIAVLLISGFILIGCSDDNENANNNQNNEGNNVESTNDNIGDNNSQNENNDTENNSLGNDSEDNDDNTDSSFEPDEEDQEGLSIGDTGRFDTIVGSYEMTLDSAELLGSEVDEVAAQAGSFILLDITIKNTGDDTQSIEDLVEAMELAKDKEMTGGHDAAEVFDSYEKFEGELEPGEEKSGHFIADVADNDTYYFMYDAGSAGAGASNQVIWEFEPEKE